MTFTCINQEWWAYPILFAVVWPFIAMAGLRRAITSPAVVAAALVPVALLTGASWFGVGQLLHLMALSPIEPRWTAGPVDDALRGVLFGLGSAGVVMILGAAKRHWPDTDRVTRAISIVIAVLVALAVPFAPSFTSAPQWLAWGGAVVGAMSAVVAMVWFVRLRRCSFSSRALRS